MQNNVFLRLAQERYTTKHYNGQQIPREEFDTLLEILRLTPTSVNAQALHYFTATSQEARERLLPAFPEFNLQVVKRSLKAQKRSRHFS
jgi:nitroreductase/dihydropteridine reductase